jgi:hypothetical protein
MRYAKDAWNNKDRVEPFQFYSEVRDHIPIINSIN